jgi:hypothetical protein
MSAAPVEPIVMHNFPRGYLTQGWKNKDGLMHLGPMLLAPRKLYKETIPTTSFYISIARYDSAVEGLGTSQRSRAEWNPTFLSSEPFGDGLKGLSKWLEDDIQLFIRNTDSPVIFCLDSFL